MSQAHVALNGHATEADEHEHEHDIEGDTMFGFWIFMMSDLLLFSILFATYGSMSVHGIASGPAARNIYEIGGVFWQTICLLGSSMTIGLSLIAMKYRQSNKEMMIWLALTFILGLGFLGLEVRDWYIMWVHHGATPMVSGYLSIFYLLTATHFVHVSAGMIWMIVMVFQVMAFGKDDMMVRLRMERLSIFWHLLDVVWIGLFSFVFLYGVAS